MKQGLGRRGLAGNVRVIDTLDKVDGDVRLLADPRRGTPRLVAGMVIANRPWRVVLRLSKLLVAALTSTAFGLATISIWYLSDDSGPVRLILVALIALTALVVYLIVAHGLWEKPSDRLSPEQARLFNTATVLTLALAVSVSYVALFVLSLLAGVLIITPKTLGGELRHEIGLLDYVALAWLASSLGTIGGALGSGLESDEDVKAAAYAHHPDQDDQRPRRRYPSGDPAEHSP